LRPIAPDCATQVREKELAIIRRTRMVSSMMSSVMLIQPLAVTVATFMVYGATGNELTASIILPALSLLGMLRFPLAFFPMLLAQLANLMVRAA
jgi:ATP-binding cassette subfamily C (CFTR/MRP) protein 1